MKLTLWDILFIRRADWYAPFGDTELAMRDQLNIEYGEVAWAQLYWARAVAR